ncbi:hypothetical protein LZC95_43760 [Pendulispora brunnea]|uniref:Uncharacterized protein n=1 Tax=Pendulispora brunnea TaxID=2905690 RepID=A0ABZ2K3S7_9BACT
MLAKRVGTAVAAAVGLLLTNTARGVPLPPPPTPCNVDTDCPGCTRCVAGGCERAEISMPTCMCNEECARDGQGACSVSATKPRCGGRCISGAPPQALTCGAGDDFPKLVALQPLSAEVEPAIRVLEGSPIVIERSPGGR